jgi:hypothetical protein
MTYSPYNPMPANSYKGNVHFHTTTSDGSNTIAEMMAAYEAAGYDFAVVTDHDAVNVDPSVADILYIGGVEETANDPATLPVISTHMSVFPAASNVVGYPDLQSIIDADAAAVHILNHPNVSLATPAWGFVIPTSVALALTDYDAIEIYNWASEHSGDYLGYALEMWDDLLTAGKRVWGIASDDAHADAWAFCGAWVHVFAAECTQAAIVAAIKAGQFYATQGPALTIAETGTTLTVSCADSSNFSFYKTGGALVETISAAMSATHAYIGQGNPKYIRCEVTRISDGLKAWTQPIFF